MTKSVPGLPAALADAYLERIGHPRTPPATVEALATLQDRHVRSVPFENLDIHLGRPLSLDLGDLAEKVITRRRGGFCYELNGLFCALLVTLGYDAWLVEARHRFDDGTRGPRFNHARILVATELGTLLVDVGSGASPRFPMVLEEGEQQVGPVTFRVRPDVDGLVTEKLVDGEWEYDWWFDTRPRRLPDFEDRCLFHQNAPDSNFRKKPLCTLVTEDGHLTLSDRQLIVTRHGNREEETVEDPLAVLATRFGVVLPHWPGILGQELEAAAAEG